MLSLARGLQVIESFHRVTDALSVSEISSRTHLSRAAVRRLLITLELLGYGVHAALVTKQRLMAEFLPVLRQQASLLGAMLA